MEQKIYDLDVKVTEIQSVVEQVQDDMQERKGKTTTDAFARVPRAQSVGERSINSKFSYVSPRSIYEFI